MILVTWGRHEREREGEREREREREQEREGEDALIHAIIMALSVNPATTIRPITTT